MDLYVHQNGLTLGPLTPEQARQGVLSGQYQLDDRAITRGLVDWTSLSEVLNLLEQQASSGQVPLAASNRPTAPVPPQTAPSPWVIGGLYSFGLVVVSALLTSSLEKHAKDIPAVGALNAMFIPLTLVSLGALVVGLVSPSVMDRVADYLPAQKARFFPVGVTRKHVAYVFGTALLLFGSAGAGTDVKGQQERQRLVLAEKTKSADEAKQKEKAEKTRKQKLADAQLQQEQEKVLAETRQGLKAIDAYLQADKEAKREREAQTRARRRAVAESRHNSSVLQNESSNSFSALRIATEKIQSQTPTKIQELEASMEWNSSSLRVSNLSSFDWSECDIYINIKSFGPNGVKCRVPSLAAGKQVTVAFSDFGHTGNIPPFSPESTPLQTVDVVAVVNGQIGTSTGINDKP